VSGQTNTDRRTERRQQTLAEIVDTAWVMVREDGLAGLSMRDLGTRVGMKAQSLYSYFGSKHEIYDAMFLQGYREFAVWMAAAVDDRPTPDVDPEAAVRRAIHAFVEFCTSDPVRYQLLFQRTVPGFTPSPEAWAVAVELYEQMRHQVTSIGVHDQATFDLWTAVMTGITDQQISNDPGGDRWIRLVDRAVDMLLTDTRTHPDRTNESEQT